MPRYTNHAMHPCFTNLKTPSPCHAPSHCDTPHIDYHTHARNHIPSIPLSHLRPNNQLHSRLTEPRRHKQRRTRRRQRRTEDPDAREVVLASQDGTRNGRACQNTETHARESHAHACTDQGTILCEGDEDGRWERHKCAGEETVCRRMGLVLLVETAQRTWE